MVYVKQNSLDICLIPEMKLCKKSLICTARKIQYSSSFSQKTCNLLGGNTMHATTYNLHEKP